MNKTDNVMTASNSDCGEPVAWARASFITDRDGRNIGTDDPELAWGKEPPFDETGWSPLYASPPSAVMRDAANALESCVNLLSIWKGWTPDYCSANRNFESLPEIENARAALAALRSLQGEAPSKETS